MIDILAPQKNIPFLCRFYVGAQPRIAMADLDLIKEILVKEFDNFSDRGFIVGY